MSANVLEMLNNALVRIAGAILEAVVVAVSLLIATLAPAT